MIARPSAWLVVAVLGGAFLAGCGGSSSSTSTAQSTSTAAPSSPTSAARPSTPTTSGPGVTANSAGAQQAAALCKATVQAASTLSASVKTKAEEICAKAAGGDLEGARKAAREACVEVINASPVPAGADKQQALAVCKAE
jgi:hypothetical protein